mgnify:CR=1 FL=1
MKINHFSKHKSKGIVHTSKATMLSTKQTFDFRGIKMGIMVILTISLLTLVAFNEVTDH